MTAIAEPKRPLMQAYIEEKQEQADAIVCTNPGVLEEYRRREAKIAELDEQQTAAADKLDLCRQVIAQKKVRSTGRWKSGMMVMVLGVFMLTGS